MILNLRLSACYSYTVVHRRGNMSVDNDGPVRSYNRSWEEIEEMLDKARSPGVLQDKAEAKKHADEELQKELDEAGPVIRT